MIFRPDVSRILFVIVWTVATLAGAACDAERGHDLRVPPMDDTFRSLWLVHNGLEFPPSKAGLLRCKSANFQPCLDVVKQVSEAKKVLLELPAEAALATTLRAIERNCHPGASHSERQICGGAINALYFFSSEAENRIILEAFRTADPETLNVLLSNEGEWMYNRPSNTEWAKLVLDTSLRDEDKNYLIERFNTTDIDSFGLMLLE